MNKNHCGNQGNKNEPNRKSMLSRLVMFIMLPFMFVLPGCVPPCNIPPCEWVDCWPDPYECCCPGEPCCLRYHYGYLSEIPKPDLTNCSLDGLVDYGQTSLKVKSSDGDHFETKLKGRVAITGGICPGDQCSMGVILLELSPLQDQIKSAKGKTISGLYVRNANPWQGMRLNDSSITMDSDNRLALQATVDGKTQGAVLNPNAWFKGTFSYNVSRLKGTGSAKNNLIKISGNFADDNFNVTLEFSIWATDCRPTVTPYVQCRPNIESGLPGHVHFDSEFDLLQNMQHSQDLCAALLADKYEEVCKSSGDIEFPTFSCQSDTLPSTLSKAEKAKHLDFTWKDGKGKVFSKTYSLDLDRMPVFPVTLTVENKWGRTVSATIKEAPVCSSDVPLEPGACAWEQLNRIQSHQKSDKWCPKGSFITALDLEGDRSASPHDAPVVGYVRCCSPSQMENVGWTSCSWKSIGRRSHQKGVKWCPEHTYLTALDLDADTGLSAHDSPIVGQARCCAPKGPLPAPGGACTWVEVGKRSHRREGSWCPENSYIAAMDLDALNSASPHDSPIVGRVLCCPLGK